MITTKQQTIARQEAKNIVREYLDSQDESELEEGIYEAIIEALKHSANTPVSGSLPLAVEFGYKQCDRGNNLEMALINFNKLSGNDR